MTSLAPSPAAASATAPSTNAANPAGEAAADGVFAALLKSYGARLAPEAGQALAAALPFAPGDMPQGASAEAEAPLLPGPVDLVPLILAQLPAPAASPASPGVPESAPAGSAASLAAAPKGTHIALPEADSAAGQSAPAAQSPAAAAAAPADAAATLAAQSPPTAESAVATLADAAAAQPQEPLADRPALAPAQATSPARGEPPSAHRIDTPVASPRWGEDLARQVVLLGNRHENRAELMLVPPQLGRVDVSLSVSAGGDTTASFVAASPQVREAIEQALPRLREILAQSGISLGQTNVSADAAPHERHEPREGRGATREASEPASAAPVWTPRKLGLVDTFA